MAPNRRIVQERPDGTWEVKAPKADSASSTHDRQGGASTARETVERRGRRAHDQGTRLKARDSDTVRPGHDLSPPCDRM